MNYIYGVLSFCGYHTLEEKTVTQRYYVAAKDKTGAINDKLHVARELAFKDSSYTVDGSTVTGSEFYLIKMKYETQFGKKLTVKTNKIDERADQSARKTKKAENDDLQDQEVEGADQDKDPTKDKDSYSYVTPKVNRTVKNHSVDTLRKADVKKMMTYNDEDDDDIEYDSDDDFIDQKDQQAATDLLTSLNPDGDKEARLRKFVAQGHGAYRKKIKTETTPLTYIDYNRMLKVVLGIATIGLAIFAAKRFNNFGLFAKP